VITFASDAAEHNPLLPPVSELIVGTVVFLVLLWLLSKFAFPNIKKTLEERSSAIEGGIAHAGEVQAEAERTLEAYRAQLAEARHEAARLRQEAQEQGAAIIAEMREQAQAEAARITAAAHAQIEADRQQALNALRGEVGRISVELAGRIVGEALTDDERQRRTVDRFLAELETGEPSEAAVSAEPVV
jgi:F-type H+-transporting ATPase subunit b